VEKPCVPVTLQPMIQCIQDAAKDAALQHETQIPMAPCGKG
jgi:hypothetical protein